MSKLPCLCRRMKRGMVKILVICDGAPLNPVMELRLLVQDFVKLAKWEDRGYYAQQQATEKAQRQLAKLVAKSEAVLALPAGPVLAAAAAAASQPQEQGPKAGEQSVKAPQTPSAVVPGSDQVDLAS